MAVPPNFFGGMTLKALLEDPNLRNPPILNNNSQVKVKKEGSSSPEPQFDYGSAFLGPNLWDKTYDNNDFNLEYMDLDEFLSENGIPVVEDDSIPSLSKSPSHVQGSPHHVQGGNMMNSPRNMAMPSPIMAGSVPPSPSGVIQSMPPSPEEQRPQGQMSPRTQSKSGTSSPTPPVSPVSLHVDFSLTEQDMALSSIPGENQFDPRKRNFSDDDLKPQPMIKKSKKVFVPDDLKDEKYWARRRKNNFAAKRSRDARRIKENQIAMRAAYLEKENDCLRSEMEKVRKENAKLKLKLAKYEGDVKYSSESDAVSASSATPSSTTL